MVAMTESSCGTFVPRPRRDAVLRNRTRRPPRLLTNRRLLQRAAESLRAVAPRVRDEPPGLASGDPRATERTESAAGKAGDAHLAACFQMRRGRNKDAGVC